MSNQNVRKFLVSRNEKRKGNRIHGLFSQEFKQSGAFRIADLGSYNSILLKPKRSAVQLSIEVRKHKSMGWLNWYEKQRRIWSNYLFILEIFIWLNRLFNMLIYIQMSKLHNFLYFFLIRNVSTLDENFYSTFVLCNPPIAVVILNS